MIQELEHTTLSHYRLRQILARGGMSIVYIAEDTRTDCTVAIKLVHKSNEVYYRHFQREVQTLVRLVHTSILPVLEWGEHDSWFYMVMPYIAYGTLKQHLTEGALSTQEAGSILWQLATALAVTHQRGIAHGDIKPSNILLHEGKYVYLADFGLARHDYEESTDPFISTQGTPEYMAPELTTQSATPASDIYALGVVLYQMLTGRLPFRSSTPIGLYWKHLHEQAIAPSFYNPQLSHTTDRVVLRALAKNPEQRFSTSLEFAHAYSASLKKSLPSFKMHVGTPAVAAVLMLCILPTLLGFSFSYLTSHASPPARVNVSETVAYTDAALAQPVAPHAITSSATTPPFLHSAPKVLMTQRVVKPILHPASNGTGKNYVLPPKNTINHFQSSYSLKALT